MRRRIRYLAPLLVVVLVGCGSKSARRHDVDQYIKRVDLIVRHYRGAVAAANDAYKHFGTGTDPAQLARLRAAEASVLAIREELRRLDPPADARRLHADIVQLVDLELRVATGATEFAQFVPAARTALAQVTLANVAFKQGFAGARSAAEQRVAFGRYSVDLRTAADGFARLAPPPALQTWQTSEVQRLRKTAAAAATLEHALSSRKRAVIDAAVAQFTRSTSVTDAEVRAQRRSIIRYDAQVNQVSRAAAKVAHERDRLQQKLG